MKTEIRRSRWIRPLLALFGGTAERSYVEVEGDALHVRFGYLFDERIPLDAIASVDRSRWPLLGGLGWRSNLVDTVALVGSYDDVVRLRLSRPMPVRLLVRIPCDTLYLSVENPDAFVAEIRRLSSKP
jgi:hypothetical protein